MMGPRQVEQGTLFYDFSLDAHVPADHLLRSIDRFVDLSEVRRGLASFYSSMGRPSVDHYFPWDFQPLQKASERYMRNHMDLNQLEALARYP